MGRVGGKSASPAIGSISKTEIFTECKLYSYEFHHHIFTWMPMRYVRMPILM